jgi:DNA-directed RNA polymerase alpha subunit
MSPVVEWKTTVMDVLDKTIDDIDMSANCYHRLMSAGVETLRDLVGRSERDLESKGFDRWSMKEIQELLEEFGLHLRTETDNIA